MPERLVEIVNLRLGVTVRRPMAPKSDATASSTKLSDALLEERPVWFADGGFVGTPVFHRSRLPHDSTLQGPAIIEQMDATTVIPPKAGIAIDPMGNIIIRLPIEGKTVS